MYKILKKRILAENIFELEILAPRVAKKCQAGQFVIVRATADGERIPLTISDFNREIGYVNVVVQVIGASTYAFNLLTEGESVSDFVGPLGNPSDLVSDVEKFRNKSILFVGGGLGAAPVYPQVKWLYENGIKSDVIIGARQKDLLILTEEMKSVCENLYISTDDGSCGFGGRVTDLIQSLVDSGKKYDHCVAIGPMIMMKFVCLLTEKLGIPTTVSINPIMVDGTGMCGACRVTVGDEIKFACVDGPEFDGHKLDFDQAIERQRIYKDFEGREYLKIKEGDTHHGGCGHCGDGND